MTAEQLAEAAALRLDMDAMRRLQRRAARGEDLAPVERMALADLPARRSRCSS